MGRWFTYLFMYVVSLPDSTAPPTVRIVHSGLACNIEEERYSERVYTIREGETLELTCLVTGHPRPQVSLNHDVGESSLSVCVCVKFRAGV